jgi:hypothetical protein
VTHINEEFYQYGLSRYGALEANEDIVIFYYLTMIANLKIERLWSVDGTFSAVSAPFYQLYTISCVKNHHVFPVVFFY